jgi:trigger factor
LLGIGEEEADKLDGNYKLTVLNINRVKPAELNQDFFDKVVGKDKVSSEADFREKLRETMAENYQGDSNYLFLRDVRNILLESTPIELPENFLKKLLKVRGKDQINEDNLEHEYQHYAEELKWNMIVNKISEEYKIEVGQEEVSAKGRELILNQLRNAGYTEESLGDNFEAIVQNYLYKEDGKNYMQTYESVRMDKV